MRGNRQQRGGGAVAFILLAATLGIPACSKHEGEAKAPKGSVPIVEAPRKGAGGQLAREETATRMIEQSVLEPPPPRSAEPIPAPDVPDTPQPPPKPPAVAPGTPEAFRMPPGAQGSASPSRPTELAAARPSTISPDPSAPRLLSRVAPEFPSEAARAGIEYGRVRARMTLDANGEVTDVRIVDATPRRIFDRAVLRAMAQWRFSEGAPGRVVESEIEFRR